jgi:hypothetical protein
MLLPRLQLLLLVIVGAQAKGESRGDNDVLASSVAFVNEAQQPRACLLPAFLTPRWCRH